MDEISEDRKLKLKLLMILKDPFARFRPKVDDQTLEILGLAAHGYTMKEIADKLTISRKTVDNRIWRSRKIIGLSKSELTIDLLKQIEEALT